MFIRAKFFILIRLNISSATRKGQDNFYSNYYKAESFSIFL